MRRSLRLWDDRNRAQDLGARLGVPGLRGVALLGFGWEVVRRVSVLRFRVHNLIIISKLYSKTFFGGPRLSVGGLGPVFQMPHLARFLVSGARCTGFTGQGLGSRFRVNGSGFRVSGSGFGMIFRHENV